MVIMLMIIFLIVPVVLTVINGCCIFIHKRLLRNIAEVTTWIIGITFTVLLYSLMGFSGSWWQVLMNVTGVQRNYVFMPGMTGMQPYIMTVCAAAAYAMAAAGLIGYVLIRCFRKRLPGPVFMVCLAAMAVGTVLSVWWMVRIGMAESDMADHSPAAWYLRLLPVNYILFEIAVLRDMRKGNMRANAEELPGM